MTKIKLGDIVKKINDNVDKDTCGIEFYIGGEHFDCGEVLITKKAKIAGSTIGPAFHKRFKPGHVLLMSRNPHLKKAGVVDFEGICSNVSFVLETKDNKILLQEYLPFILQTEKFWHFASSNKKGSTNYFLNWKDFERYEFELPSLEEQKKLAKILWCAERLKQKYFNANKTIADLSNKRLEKLFNQNEKLTTLSYYCDIVKERYHGQNTHVKALELECFDSGNGKLLSLLSEITGGSAYTTFKKGDILFGKLRPYLKKYYLSDFEGICCNEIWALRPNKNSDSNFIYAIVSSDIFIDFVNSKTFGTKMPRVDWKTAASFPLPQLSKLEQEHIIREMKIFEKQRRVFVEQIENIKAFQDNLLNGGQVNVH